MRISDWSSDVCSSDLFCQSAIMRATSLSCARNRARACAMTDQFQLTEDQLAIQEMAQRFTADNITPFAAEWDEQHHFPRDIIQMTGELGFGVIYVSEESGGIAIGRLDIVRASCRVRVCVVLWVVVVDEVCTKKE